MVVNERRRPRRTTAAENSASTACDPRNKTSSGFAAPVAQQPVLPLGRHDAVGWKSQSNGGQRAATPTKDNRFQELSLNSMRSSEQDLQRLRRTSPFRVPPVASLPGPTQSAGSLKAMVINERRRPRRTTAAENSASTACDPRNKTSSGFAAPVAQQPVLPLGRHDAVGWKSQSNGGQRAATPTKDNRCRKLSLNSMRSSEQDLQRLRRTGSTATGAPPRKTRRSRLEVSKQWWSTSGDAHEGQPLPKTQPQQHAILGTRPPAASPHR
ncbi:hypothetical protein Pan216_11830 [Planctomycetes bacterium Pan216]|uniref:Uncharacterized protein n=1 Tax=Kolteria novifilia TaxID=2527975 RepID=A0A518B062_9BACT|nr:hypothetical protein Pan216_11830 [Planctomycetes bacterium Pan216]